MTECVELFINEDTATIKNHTIEAQWTIKTELIFGKIVGVTSSRILNDKTINSYTELAEITSLNVAEHIFDDEWFCLFGLKEYGGILMGLYPYIHNQKQFYPTADIVNKIRMENLYELSSVPEKRNFATVGFRYSHLNTPLHVVLAIFDFYAVNHYCLKKCAFCGKWFAVKDKSKAQQQFCNDNYTYTDWNGKTYEYTTHKEAKDSIMRRCQKRFEAIEKNLDGRLDGGKSSSIYKEFINNATTKRDYTKEFPTIENVISYETYLYVDCKKYYKRYGRKEK